MLLAEIDQELEDVVVRPQLALLEDRFGFVDRRLPYAVLDHEVLDHRPVDRSFVPHSVGLIEGVLRSEEASSDCCSVESDLSIH